MPFPAQVSVASAMAFVSHSVQQQQQQLNSPSCFSAGPAMGKSRLLLPPRTPAGVWLDLPLELRLRPSDLFFLCSLFHCLSMTWMVEMKRRQKRERPWPCPLTLILFKLRSSSLLDQARNDHPVLEERAHPLKETARTRSCHWFQTRSQHFSVEAMKGELAQPV